MIDMTPYVLITGMLVGGITAVTQMLKVSFKIPKRLVPIVSCIVGVIAGLLFKEFTVYSYYTMALVGFMGGLSASGFFELTKFNKPKN